MFNLKNVSLGAKKPSKRFCEKCCGSFWGDFSKNRKIPKLGVVEISKTRLGKKGGPPWPWASQLLPKIFLRFPGASGRLIFRKFHSPPPGGNQFPGKTKKWLWPNIFMLKNAGLGGQKPSKHFRGKCCGSFWGDFSKNPKIPKMGVSPKFQNPFRVKRWASLALGP